MASHIAVDLTKVAGVRAINFNEADLLTCLANDYGYEHWVEKALEYYADPIDLVVLISSSGVSSNIVNGARQARQMKLPIITFSGFDADNVLRKLGDLNFWVESHAYNIVEMTHHIWLLALVDKLVADNSGGA
jgi:D-sedoheptulose 7-phosphate isomerase